MVEKKTKHQKKKSSHELASEVIKRHAKKQQIRIKLTKSQLESIQKQWKMKDPKKPSEITFVVDRKPEIELKVAGYSYSGTICCV